MVFKSPPRTPPRAAAAPAAAVVKGVTATALYERGFSESVPTCWSGGFHALRARDLVSDPRHDRECSTLPEAFGRSINTVFARRALELLTPAQELDVARRWGFTQDVPFDAPVGRSDVTIPDDTPVPFTPLTLPPNQGVENLVGVGRIQQKKSKIEGIRR